MRPSVPDRAPEAAPPGTGAAWGERAAGARAGSEHPMALDGLDLGLLRAGSAEVAPWPLPAPTTPRRGAPGRRLLEGWRAALRAPVRVLGVGLFAYLLTFNLSVVRGSSMAPGIRDGDRILIDQLSYLLGEVERGDIVVLRYPLDPSLDYIKRVVGLPGDELLIAGGEVWVNGERLREDYLEETDLHTRLRVVVSEGHYFVLGDNRPHSSDSREFGEVPAELVRGKVDVRLWPPSRAGLLR